MPKLPRRRPIDLSVLNYDGAATVAGAHEGRETVSDWDRYVKGGDFCKYYINGVKLADIRRTMLAEGKCQQLGFETLDELQDFFRDYLFKEVRPRRKAQLAAEQACLRLHQAGIQNATFNDFEHRMPGITFPKPAVTTINFNSTPDGVEIIEEHFINTWWENNKIKHKSDDYCVTTETTYFFKPGDPGQISLKDMRIDCRDPALKPVFAKYAQETSVEDYHHTFNARIEDVDHMLYYPQKRAHQQAICEYCRNCFYIDYVTKDLHYINAYGTVIPVPETNLHSKEIEKIQTSNNARVIEFTHENQHGISEISVPHHYSKEFGHVMHMTQAKMKMLIPENFNTDLLFKYSENLLHKLQQDQTLFSRVSSLFGGDAALATQERLAILAIVQQFTITKPALQIRKYQQKPAAMTFSGKGESLYVFVENVEHPDKSRFWYVDRSEETPKWVEFPINLDQTTQIHTLFDGAQHFEKHKPKEGDLDFERDVAWYQLGEGASTTQHTDHSVSVTLKPDACKQVVNLLVSPMRLGQTLVEDWSYNEAFDALSNTIRTTEVTARNVQIIKRCGQIQEMLRYFGEHFDRYFPNTRGIVPYDKRIQVLKMMNEIVAEPDSAEAQHYFRNQHRIYNERYEPSKVYEPSSFVWLDEQLHYIGTDRYPVIVPMTSAIEKTLRRLKSTNSEHISAEEVYQLMTRPRLFHYVCGIPIGLNCQALKFEYFEVLDRTLYIPISMTFNRSQGLHTGTAQEMMLEIRDIHLSLRTLLFKLFEFFLIVVFPTVLQGFGYTIPMAWLGLTALEQSITNWFMLIWSASLFHSLLAWIGVSNLLVRPEFNALDTALNELSGELNQISTHSLESLALNEFSDDDTLSVASDETVPFCGLFPNRN